MQTFLHTVVFKHRYLRQFPNEYTLFVCLFICMRNKVIFKAGELFYFGEFGRYVFSSAIDLSCANCVCWSVAICQEQCPQYQQEHNLKSLLGPSDPSHFSALRRTHRSIHTSGYHNPLFLFKVI